MDFVYVLLRSAPVNFILKGATGIANLGLEPDYYSQDPSASGGTIHVSGRIGCGAILREGAFAQSVGAMAHEFGHSLGLPDLQDLVCGGPEDDSAGIGNWGLMGRGATGWSGDDGPVPLCAWSRLQLGWVGVDNERLVDLGRDSLGLVIGDLHEGGAIYRIPLRVQSSQRTLYDQEYLLLEHRWQTAHLYNRPLPEGLLVWHVDRQAQYAVKGWLFDNKDEGEKLVDLVCADGLYRDAGFDLGQVPAPRDGRDNLDFWAHDESYRRAHGGNLGDGTDPFDGVRFTRFDPSTNPASWFGRVLASAATGLSLSSIRRQGQGMVVDLRLPAWAGTISGDVFWSGEVLVDGDLHVPSEGRLYIYGSTVVRFAGSDRLRAGRDPSRCELTVDGVLRVLPLPSRRSEAGVLRDAQNGPVVFEAQRPGGSWWGILASDSASVDLPEHMAALRDAVHDRVLGPADTASLESGRPTAVVEAAGGRAAAYGLGPNLPNPFSQQTRLRFSLAAPNPVAIDLFDALGQRVRGLVHEERAPGEQEVAWDGLDEEGRLVASGLYVARMQVPGQYAASHKMMRLPGGFARVTEVDSTLRARGAGWGGIGAEVLRRPAAEYGAVPAATPARIAFTLGSLGVRLTVLGQDPEARQTLQPLAEQVVALIEGYAPSPSQRSSLDAFARSMRSATPSPAQALAALRPTLERILEDGDEAAVTYFLLGEWIQTLDVAGAAARSLAVPVSALVRPAANAEVGQFYAAQLGGEDAALGAALQQLALSLQAGLVSQPEIEAVCKALELR